MLGIGQIKKLVNAGVSFIGSINNTSMKIVGLEESFNRISTVSTKVVGATTGAAGLARGANDAAEAFLCNDGICLGISGIGCLADSLQIASSFIIGPNVTMVVTAPVSIFCKVFVATCKGRNLPWGGCS